MTLSIDQLQSHIASRFPDVERIDESVIRFTRRLKNKPFAVYYVDVDEELPETPEQLASYQDRIIGNHYFDGAKSLQWSNYLYFVVSDAFLSRPRIAEVKEVIEDDRTYARKFVVTEAEFESAIEPPAVKPAAALPQASIFSTWMTLLTDANLDRIVQSDQSLRLRVEHIESQSEKAPKRGKRTTPTASTAAQPFMRSLELKRYRPFPAQPRFDFGNVNLVFGVNGSGKTSLFEAIELLYCGRTKRNPNDKPSYSLAATFSDGNSETATNRRTIATFRERNLLWYGQAENRTNNLYQSFAQYNFLNTDAAVGLAETSSNLKDYLSKLLVGPETSQIEHEIDRTQDAVASRLRELEGQRQLIESEAATLDKQLKDAANIKMESASIFLRLKEVLGRIGWKMPDADNDEAVGTLVESLVDIQSIASQVVSVEWAGSPMSLERLRAFAKDATKRNKKAEKELTSFQAIKHEEQRVANEVQQCKTLQKVAKELGRIVESGLSVRLTTLEQLESEIATYSGILVGYDETVESTTNVLVSGVTVTAFEQTSLAERMSAEQEHNSVNSEHSTFTATRDKALQLAEELRNVAAELLADSPNPDVCPLCHSEFGPGELQGHIHRGIDALSESKSQEIISRLKQSVATLQSARAKERVAKWLVKLCARTKVATTVTVHDVLASVRDTRHKLEEAESKRDVIVAEVESLESRGVTTDRYEELLEELAENERPVPEVTKEIVGQLCATIANEQEKAVENLEAQRQKANQLLPSIQQSLEITDTTIEALKTACVELRERITTTETLIERLSASLQSFPWPSERPISELLVEVAAIRNVAADYQAAVSQERNAKSILATSTNKKKELANKLADLKPKIEKLTKAVKTFETIQKDHPLEVAMEDALRQNRFAIETIFKRIHAPAEFSQIGEDISTLIRESDGSKASLSQISTGQRAAFALSLFLAQNAQLRLAPPVVLIDDPIAHVDDLNCLSFLDYLRDVTIDGQRQIFFSTANEKLAVLFERKFDFLGDEFRRFDLPR